MFDSAGAASEFSSSDGDAGGLAVGEAGSEDGGFEVGDFASFSFASSDGFFTPPPLLLAFAATIAAIALA